MHMKSKRKKNFSSSEKKKLENCTRAIKSKVKGKWIKRDSWTLKKSILWFASTFIGFIVEKQEMFFIIFFMKIIERWGITQKNLNIKDCQLICGN